MYYMYHSEHINLRLPSGLLARLDEQRGGVPRSAYLRKIIERGLGSDTTPLPQQQAPKVESVSTDTTSQEPIESTLTTHQHRWIGSLGHRRCSTCGEEA